MRPGKFVRRHLQRRARNERGMVMAWFGITLLVLMAFAGFGIDVGHWWYEGQRQQQAADAAAHAGVVFLPADLAQAKLVARQEAAQNGFNDGIIGNAPVNANITVTQEPNPNRLRVKISRVVPSFFVKLIGIADPTITRQAVAEYVAPVPMGSPENKLGNDPDNGYNPQLWLNIAGPAANKSNGDRYAAKNCTNMPGRCDTSQTPANLEYSQDGYFFNVDVKTPVSGQPLKFDFYDPQMVNTGDTCGSNMPSGLTTTQWNQLKTWYGSNADQRYAAGANVFCTGDTDLGGHTLQTTYIFRDPDNTPWNNTDNPITASCAPRQIAAFDPGNPTTIYNQLVSEGPNFATNVAAGNLTFSTMFHRWATLCSIPANQVKTGKYVVQIRTNAVSGSPTVYDPNNNLGGHNRFSMRTGFGTSGVNNLSGTNAAIYASGRLPLYANASGANSQFYLARIMPYDAGRVLRINLWDMGDASAAGALQIIPPAEYATTIGGCTFSRDDNGSLSVTAGTCTLNNVSASNGFDGHLVTVDVPIPSDYTCTTSSNSGCWFKIGMIYPTGTNVTDTTTWTATVVGNPVRLVE